MEANHPSALTPPGSNRIVQLVRRYPLAAFFTMAYAFTWIISTPYVLSSWGILKGDYLPLFILKPFAGPTLSAVLVTAALDGKPGLRRLRERMSWRTARWRWVLISLVAIPALLLLGMLVQPSLAASFQGLTAKAVVSYPIYLVIVFFGVALPEEIGWRGFALPRMQPRYGPLWGTLLLGVLWAFWHLLFFLTPDHGGGPGANPVQVLISFAIFLVMVVALSIIFTWVFNHTGGSVFMANLVHACIDTPQLVWVPLFLAASESTLDLACLIGFGLPALLILLLTRGRLGYPEAKSLETEPAAAGV